MLKNQAKLPVCVVGSASMQVRCPLPIIRLAHPQRQSSFSGFAALSRSYLKTQFTAFVALQQSAKQSAVSLSGQVSALHTRWGKRCLLRI
jgi:hypothetical protein